MSMNKVCVGVTGLDVSDHPMSGLGIAKCLKLSREIKLVGISYNPLSSGCYSGDVFDEVYLLGNSLNEERKFFEDMVRLKEKHGLHAVIPGTPWEVPLYSRLRNRFKSKGIGVLLPRRESVVNTLDPQITTFAFNAQIRIPPYILIQDRRGLARKLSTLLFPVIIKGMTENCVAYDMAEAQVFIRSLLGGGDTPLCVQEYVNGEEYSVAALANEDYKLAGIVIVKNLVLTDHGTPWIVVSVYDRKLEAFTEKLIQHLKWVGPLELRFIKETTSGAHSLIKFHPCFPSWIYLTPAVGQNLPLKAVKLILGKITKDSTRYSTGAMYVRNSEDIICDVQTLFSLTTSGRLIHHGKSG